MDDLGAFRWRDFLGAELASPSYRQRYLAALARLATYDRAYRGLVYPLLLILVVAGWGRWFGRDDVQLVILLLIPLCPAVIFVARRRRRELMKLLDHERLFCPSCRVYLHETAANYLDHTGRCLFCDAVLDAKVNPARYLMPAPPREAEDSAVAEAPASERNNPYRSPMASPLSNAAATRTNSIEFGGTKTDAGESLKEARVSSRFSLPEEAEIRANPNVNALITYILLLPILPIALFLKSLKDLFRSDESIWRIRGYPDDVLESPEARADERSRGVTSARRQAVFYSGTIFACSLAGALVAFAFHGETFFTAILGAWLGSILGLGVVYVVAKFATPSFGIWLAGGYPKPFTAFLSEETGRYGAWIKLITWNGFRETRMTMRCAVKIKSADSLRAVLWLNHFGIVQEIPIPVTDVDTLHEAEFTFHVPFLGKHTDCNSVRIGILPAQKSTLLEISQVSVDIKTL